MSEALNLYRRVVDCLTSGQQIDKRNLYAQREDLNRGYFEVFWISVLIQNYKVSAKYLLFGKGKMFTK